MFHFSDEEVHMDVHDRALLYYRLLKANPKEVTTHSAWLHVKYLYLHFAISVPNCKTSIQLLCLIINPGAVIIMSLHYV